jgi:uncharacterized membrane protein YhaH (DUF805 family)
MDVHSLSARTPRSSVGSSGAEGREGRLPVENAQMHSWPCCSSRDIGATSNSLLVCHALISPNAEQSRQSGQGVPSPEGIHRRQRKATTMNMIEAVGSCFRKYANFSGRAVRSEYWYWSLFSAVACVVFGVIDETLNPGTQFGIFSAVTAFVTVALILPGLAVSARRLHDVDRSGWWLLLGFTVVGIIPLVYWACLKGTLGQNRFGSELMLTSRGLNGQSIAATA